MKKKTRGNLENNEAFVCKHQLQFNYLRSMRVSKDSTRVKIDNLF
mgnify:FL=1